MTQEATNEAVQSPMRRWRVKGTKGGKVATAWVDAPDWDGAVLAASKGRYCMVVHEAVLVGEGE